MLILETVNITLNIKFSHYSTIYQLYPCMEYTFINSYDNQELETATQNL